MTYAVTRRRWEGLLDAWREVGGAPGDLRIAVCQANAAGLGEAFADELFRTGDPPDAIAAMSDELALGALRAAARAGGRRSRHYYDLLRFTLVMGLLSGYMDLAAEFRVSGK